MKPLIINSLEQAKELVSLRLKELGSPKICFVGQRASDVFIFKDLIPVDTILCLDFGKDAGTLEKVVPLISLEKNLGTRGQWYSRQLPLLLGDKNLERKIEELLPPGSVVVPYSVFGELEKFCQKKRLKLLGTKAEVKERLENKRFVFELRKELGLPTPRSRLLDIKTVGYRDLVEDFGKKFIVQRFDGSSGSGTEIIESKTQFDLFKSKLEVDEKVIVSVFVDGPTISLNGVVTRREAYFFCPSLQVIGNGETAPRPTIFSGVDYAAGKFIKNKEELFTIAQKVTERLRREGFLGIFNLNLMANGLVLTDINPRLMGSGQLMTEMQIEQDEVSLALLHLMIFLGIDFILSEEMREKVLSPKDGSFIVLHSLAQEKKAVKGDLPIGLYRLDNGKLKFIKEALEFRKIRGDSEVLVAGPVPQKGKIVEPEAPVLRIFTKEPVLDFKNFKLNKKYKLLCRKIYGRLNL